MKCEYCGKEHDGSYGKGRFCSAYCARGFSTKAKRKQINKKVSSTLRKKSWSKRLSNRNKEMFENGWKPPIFKSEVREMAAEARRKKYLNKKVRKFGIELNITNSELEKYRKTHTVCEICGKPEKTDTTGSGCSNRLSIDHNHSTGEFRGLLCNSCNRILGYYEKNRDRIEEYLDKKGRDYIPR